MEQLQNSDYHQAAQRLWKVIPVGHGRDFNLVLKHCEHLQQMLDRECRD